MNASNIGPFEVTSDDLQKLFLLKYGDPKGTGWSPRRRLQFGYYRPSDCYEALVSKLVTTETDWIDVGGGSALFPENPPLSQQLAARARRVVVVDPSDTIDANPFPHERAKCLIEQYQTNDQFDLATLRMVAEHIANPSSVAKTLNRILRHDGIVVIFTVNRWSPVTVISHLLPFWSHYPIKKMFWGGDEEDTFPTVYKMNTRKTLLRLFRKYGFEECQFRYLDDLSVFGRFKHLNYVELFIWRLLKRVRLRYPENCLLGVYQKTKDVA